MRFNLINLTRRSYLNQRKNAMATLASTVVIAAIFWFLPLIVADLSLIRAAEITDSGNDGLKQPVLRHLYGVERVINTGSIVLTNGDVVRLASLRMPEIREESGAHRPDEPMGREVKSFLEKLLSGRKVRLRPLSPARDRNNRLIAHLYLEDGRWIQGELLAAGMGIVYPLPNSGSKTEEMLKIEAEARRQRRGIWNDPHYATVSDVRADSIPANRFTLVEGVVRGVTERRGNIYINFGDDWKSDFTAFISRKDSKNFADTDIFSLEGKRVRVRGWLYFYNGAAMDISTPKQIELLPISNSPQKLHKYLPKDETRTQELRSFSGATT